LNLNFTTKPINLKLLKKEVQPPHQHPKGDSGITSQGVLRLNQVAPYPELEENSEAEEIGGPAEGVYPPFTGKLKRNSVKPIISNRVNASINLKRKK